MQISVIIPAFNEAATIGRLVQFILHHGGPLVKEVIVADGESADDTGVTAKMAGARVVRCKRSRAVQMNAATRLAKADVFYFVHADVQLLPSFATDILQAVQAGFDAGCYRYRFDSGKLLLKLNAYFTRFGSLIYRGGDQTLFITRRLFQQLDGFNEAYSIMEDYELLQRIRKNGRFIIIPASITVSARKYAANSWLKVQLANLTVFSMYLLGGSPERMQRLYRRMLRVPR